MANLLNADFALAEKNTLYRCLDRLVEYKDELCKFLTRRWGELFDAKFDVLLYDLTSTYFESDVERSPEDLRQYGYSRDKRGDCRQVVIALIVTPEGFPLSYEVLAGNTADSTTLSDFLDRIEQRYGRANRIWVMDRGIPTEESLAKMRQVRRREGRYLLRTNLAAHEPEQLWTFYIQLTEVEQAFKELKHDLAVRPIITTRKRASRRTSSSPSSPTACRSRSRRSCALWPAASHRARCLPSSRR